MTRIGAHTLQSCLILAPMAGISDLPMRRLCRDFGAGLAVSEMLTSDTKLWASRKSMQRLQHEGDRAPRAIQIAGNDPEQMAHAAQLCQSLGADIVDINMGCPAKKVCKKAAGSALLRDENLVANILQNVVAAVSIPVTLKIRTGWSPDERNAVRIARIAEAVGIQALAVHGRTRACRFNGHAEYDTIAEVVRHVGIPVFANGDIDTPQKAKRVLEHTGAAGLLIGRAARGRPWIFREINHYLDTGILAPAIDPTEHHAVMHQHFNDIYACYGDFLGPRIARKHFAWYLEAADEHENQHLRQQFNQLETAREQLSLLATYFETLFTTKENAA